MTKAANKRAIKALPALRTSLLWYKRDLVRQLKRRAQDVTSSKLRAVYLDKARKIATTDLADLRQSYQAERVAEICRTPRFELTHAVREILWLTANA